MGSMSMFRCRLVLHMDTLTAVSALAALVTHVVFRE